jgi:bifunctional non-homologous end joining protein LigD
VSAKSSPSCLQLGPLGARTEHDGYRLQIHVRDGRVRLYTINGANWSKRYPLVVRDAARIEGSAIIDAEVVWLDSDGMAVFDALHSRVNDAKASACAFDLMMLNGEDLRRRPYVERKAALRKLLRQGRGIQYVEHAEGHGDKLFAAACKLGLEGIVSKKLNAPYKSEPSKAWLKIKNPKAPAATRVIDGTF